MNEKPDLSIIIPIYNVGKYLEECLNSVCYTSAYNIEIILVDDGSVDESGSICDKYARNFKNIVVIHKANRGLVSARQAGVELARGRYVTFIDGDDWVDGEMYDSILDKCYKLGEPQIFAYGCIEEYSNFQKKIINNISKGMYLNEKLELLKDQIITGDVFFEWKILPHLCDKMIERNLLKKHINEVPEFVTFGEDAACSFPCMMEAKSIYISDITPYHYRQREGSIVKSKKELEQRNFIAIYRILNQAFALKDALTISLKRYMFFLLLLKSYSALENIMPLPPFKKVKLGSKILVYGAGGFGNVIEEYIEKRSDFFLAGWTDKRADEYRKTNPKINYYNCIFDKEYDYIVISILNEKVAEDIKNDFIKKGIPEQKIDWVSGTVLDKMPLPDWIM